MNGHSDSHFLITLKAMPELDGRYVAFGRVICGATVLQKLSDAYGTKGGRPLKVVRIFR